jgi:hypothetical protein
MTYDHVHVSEVPDSPVVECTFASGLEVARAALAGTDRQPPATWREREALRIAAGVPDNRGASIADLRRGLAARYGLVLPETGLPNLLTLPEGTFVAVQGNYHDLPAHYQRWDPGFAGHDPAAHCVTVYMAGGVLHWCDPLAPWGSYDGEPIDSITVGRYFSGLPGAACTSARVPPQMAHTLHIAPGATVQVASFGTACIDHFHNVATHSDHESTAPCSSPKTYPLCGGGHATIAKVSAGTFAGSWVHAGSPGVYVI